jgi:transcriptional regulator with XRE-family HTH domain
LGPLAELIQRYLDLRQLSVRQAAARAGMSHEALSRIMAGKVRAPHAKTIEKLGAGLGIPVRELREAVARNLEESYVVEDITTSEALQIAIARVGEQWLAMLAAAVRFHDYSWRNVVLILAQRPDARQVAGYRTWQSLGRQVRKGEKGIAVIAPVIYRPAEEDGAETSDEPTDETAAAERYFRAGRRSISSTSARPTASHCPR